MDDPVGRVMGSATMTSGYDIRWFNRTWLALLLAFFLSLGLARPGFADPTLEALATTNFNALRQGVDGLAVSGHPRALDILTALQTGTLHFSPDKTLFIKRDDGWVAAATGAAATDLNPRSIRPIRLNNAVRSAIEAALGGLRLFSTDRVTRLAAAEAVFRARDPAAIPVLDRAMARESDAGVKTRMEQARAAATLASSDSSDSDKLAAIAVLRARGDIEARSVLASMTTRSAPVAEARENAVTGIDRVLQMWSILQSVYYGLSLGSVLLLAAAGLAITFGVMGVINMAHGEMVMIGAYTTFVVQGAIKAWVPGLYWANLLIAIPMAFLVAGMVGVAIERGLIRFLYGRPLETLLATWGLSLALQQAVRSIFGANNRDVDTPGWMSGATQLGGLTLTWNRTYIILFAVLVLAGLMAVLRYTALGLRMRAVTQNRQMAAAMGIRTPWVDAMTFGLGSGVAGMAGVALSQIDNVSPNLGQGYIIDSFMVVVFGGVGNLWGTTLGALTLGIVNKFLEPVAGAVLGKIVVLVLLILFIQGRPRGMFPLKGRAMEA
jgi:urea transport system permease protein